LRQNRSGQRTAERLPAVREGVEVDQSAKGESVVMSDFTVPREWRLTEMEARLFGMLVARDVVPKEAMMLALYPSNISQRKHGRRPINDAPGIKILDVMICRIRKKVAPSGVVIDTLWGRGLRVDPDTLAQLKLREAA
jgi:DNA-binding response OmpR family regulator